MFFQAVTCGTSIPDDAPEAGEPDAEHLVGGKTIALLLAEWLATEQFRVAPPELHDGHCWELGARYGSRSFHITVFQLGGEVTIATREFSFFLRKWISGRSVHRRLVQLLHDFLERDGRFHAFRWQSVRFGLEWSPVPVVTEKSGSVA